MSSPFLGIPEEQWLASNRLAFAVYDRYPVSPGHALVIPRREVPDWLAASQDERSALIDLVGDVLAILQRERSPDGFNVGFNLGNAAGQTVGHLHVHVIPRYAGDVDDPTGGVRGVIPGKANYLKSTKI